MLDDQSQVVRGFEVKLKIEGVNPGTLTATTDSSGVATFSYVGEHEGSDTVTATAALLTSNKANVSWISADSIAPVTTASLSPEKPDGQDGKYASPVTVSLSASDNDTGVAVTEYRVNGGTWKNYTGPFSIGTDGTYSVEYRSKDNTGNEETVKSISFTILYPVENPDTEAPATTATINPTQPDGKEGWYISSPVKVTLSASDDMSGVKATLFSLDGGDWKDYSSPVSISDEGQHNFEYRSTDYKGNQETVKSISFRIDTNKPNLSSTLNPAFPDGENGWYVSPVIQTVSVSDGGSGLSHTDYRIDNGDWQAYSNSIKFDTDGTYKVDVRAEDLAGNLNSLQTVTVKLDRVKPLTTAVVNPSTPNGADGDYASDVSITLTASDGDSKGSGLAKTEYRLDDAIWKSYDGSPIIVSSTGSHKVEYRSVDKAGNIEDTKSVSFVIDKAKAPQVFFNPQTGGRNVSLLESGATVIATSSSYDGFHTPQAMLDFSSASLYPWATSSLTNQYVKFALAGNKTYLIDKVQLMPRIDYANQRVKDFEIAVSTTTPDNSAFTTVLKATAADNGKLQDFILEKPVMAKYIMYRPLNTQGSSTVISTQQLKVNTGQEGGKTVHFDNLTSVDPEATIVSWNWDFGDKNTSTEQSPTHTYGAPGTYKVTLTATDSKGKTGTFSLNQTVFEPAVADFTFDPVTINEGQSVTFTDTSVQPNGGSEVQRTWNWGDNTPEIVKDGATSSASVAHTFKDNGTYMVNLLILDDKGQDARQQKPVTVNNLPPTVTVTGKQYVKSAQSISFNPTIKDPGGDAVTCKWDFGDNTGSNQCSASHIYPTLGDGAEDKNYTAKLTVTDKDGASVTITTDVVVYSPYINTGSAITDSDLYFSRYCAADNVRKLQFTYDGNVGFSLTSPQPVSKVGYADGLIFAPDGDLLSGGGSYVYKINRETGESIKQPAGATAYHLMLDKSGKKLWAAGIPGSLIEFPLDPVFGPGTVHSISGDENAVTSVAFDAAGNAFYTNSRADGYGTFGKIDLTTFKTTRLLSNVQAAHGMFFDSYTGHLILDGGNQLLQFDPVTEKVVSVYTSPVGVTFDQGAADGKGHILVASNSGHLLFLDYSKSKEVGNPHNFTATPYVESCMDDVAPLSGFGSVPPTSIELTPSVADHTVGDTTEMKALVKDAKGHVVAGYPVNLKVTGANAGTYTVLSNADGIATFSYKGTNGGEDTAVATAGKAISASAKAKWKYPAAAVKLTPASATQIIGEEHQLKATVLDSNDAPKTGVTVKLEITGENPSILTGMTDSNGEVSFSYKGEKAGTDTLTAKVTEGTKVIASDPAAVTWKLRDVAPPVTTAVANAVDGPSGGWYHSAVTVSLTASDDVSGVKSIEYRIPGGEWNLYTAPLSLTENGIYTYEYRSTDNEGNVETAKTIIVNLDKAAPVTLYHLDPIYSKNKLGQTYISGFNVSLRASDTGGSGVDKTYYRINGSSWQTYNGSFIVTAGVTHTVEYYTIDKAGNVEGPTNKMDFDRGVFTGAGKY
ncbi:OmpL47-type beta-barrel domain-containing protein [Bacillus sp. JJ1764]|uniref:OmpL47-type beta-barrel domain-containing protein n=1 Tax=Bacillus sp. JJ1764 TaxID=3122964 RepID=UPI002FFEA6AE